MVAKGYVARRNAKFRPKAFSILQEKVVQYLAWRDVRREQIKVDLHVWLLDYLSETF